MIIVSHCFLSSTATHMLVFLRDIWQCNCDWSVVLYACFSPICQSMRAVGGALACVLDVSVCAGDSWHNPRVLSRPCRLPYCGAGEACR